MEERDLMPAPIEQYIDIDTLPDPSSLYQVELLIFKNNQTDNFDQNGIISEQWPDELTLAYPETLDFVHPPLPNTIETTERLIEIENETLMSNQASSTPTERLINIEVSGTNLRRMNARNDNHQTTSAYTKKEIALSKLALLTELPMHALALSEANEKISRNTVHRVLYHRAWIQSLDNSFTAKAIPIAGGEKYNDHYQLEGHVTISKDRFLHIKTDLWLMEFTAIELSEKEIQKQSFAHHSVFNLEKGGFSRSLPDLPIDYNRITMVEDQALNNYINTEIDQAVNEIFYSAAVGSSIDKYSDESIGNGLFELAEEINEQATKKVAEAIAKKENQEIQYQPNKVYVVRQNKKISSRQINYLDHPKMGIIVSIKKHILPEND
ncbi:MAG: CsiV family protein [Pseudomonadota bacterium]|nr:CsiV family protein [Pseudomonadota bacterium]